MSPRFGGIPTSDEAWTDYDAISNSTRARYDAAFKNVVTAIGARDQAAATVDAYATVANAAAASRDQAALVHEAAVLEAAVACPEN